MSGVDSIKALIEKGIVQLDSVQATSARWASDLPDEEEEEMKSSSPSHAIKGSVSAPLE